MRKLISSLLILVILFSNGIARADWDSSTDMQALTVSAAVLQVQNCLKAIDGTTGAVSTNLNTKNLQLDGATSGTITLTPAATAGTNTYTLPAATGATMLSSLTTNAPDVVNSIWGVSNGLTFEGATANDYEVNLTPTDPTADRTQTIQNNSGVIPLGTAGNTIFFTTTGATNFTLPTSGTIGASKVIFCWNGADANTSFVTAANFVTTTGAYSYLTGDNSGNYVTVLNSKYLHSSSVAILTVWCNIWQTSSGANRYAQCKVVISTANGAVNGTVNQVTPEWNSFTVDVSGLTNATTYDMSIQLNQAGTGGAVNPMLGSIIIFTDA